ncbi:MAG: acyclic terpene utilization AtuA family protein [Lautropia sp.]
MKQSVEGRKVLRIGAGASYAGDRVEPATELAANGDLDYLVYETLAERTIALAQLDRIKNPDGGYNELLEDRFRAALPHCKRLGTRIVTSMGAANPIGAMKRTAELVKELGLGPMKIAAVFGDDVLDYCRQHRDTLPIMETGEPLSSLQGEIVAANVYLGAEGIVDALQRGADIVITGRVGDCSLFLGPMIHEFGWSLDDWETLGRGQIGADMVECGANVSGGFFADPGYKEVPELWNLGYPFIEIEPDGTTVVSKVPGTGGLINRATCLEQMLYEIHDPANYITPDVVVDFSKVELDEIGPDRVRIRNGRGRARPETLKVSVCIKEGWMGEGEITYAGLGCLERARLAEKVVRERLKIGKVELQELRVDYVGISSLHMDASLPRSEPPYEVRLRFAGRAAKKRDAEKLANEVETLVGKGPSSSCLPRKYVKEILAVYSCLMPRAATQYQLEMMEVQ